MSRMLELQMSNAKAYVTGSLVFRDASADKEAIPPGTKLMMVFGVVAVPDNFPIPSDNQVRVLGYANRDSVELHTQVDGKPLGDQYAGWTVNDVLMAPVWKA
jgi:hypothetical protein